MFKKTKLFKTYCGEVGNKYVIVLCPDIYEVKAQAALLLRERGYEKELDSRLPGMSWVSGHSKQEIQLFLHVINRRYWDFNSFKVIEVDVDQMPKYNGQAIKTIEDALFKRLKRDETIERWLG
jgi:hypothetical protein